MNPEWTGERMETFVFNESAIEHLHRYAVAKRFVKNKTVLDIACGEGFGAAFFSEEAKEVVGIDLDEPTIAKARVKYARENLAFKAGSVTSIPCQDHYFDVVVSFETLEHVSEHNKMLEEIKRVLRPGGIFIVSTPNKEQYSDASHYSNPFHLKELYEPEFRKLVDFHFKQVRYFRQDFVYGSLINENGAGPFEIYTGDYTKITEAAPPGMYLLAIASDGDVKECPSSFFYDPEIFKRVIENEIAAIKNSPTYRLGHMITGPFKWVRSFLKS
jgi:SAM-dependent methyltransferase